MGESACVSARRVARVVIAVAAALVLAAAPAAATGDDVVGEMQERRARYQDTLLDLARTHKLGYVEMLAANPGVDPWLPGEGTRVVLPTAHLVPKARRRGIVINLSEMRLYYFPRSGAAETYPLGIGREGWETPAGRTSILRKAANPTWYPPASIRAEDPTLPKVVPPGPDNPLGRHALYLGLPGIRIHGTNKPDGVGRRVSHGCIRMYPEDVERLFQIVPVGTRVVVVDQQVKFGWIGGELYVEVHPSATQADEIEFERAMAPDLAAGLLAGARDAAGEDAGRLDLAAILRAGLERRGYPVRISR